MTTETETIPPLNPLPPESQEAAVAARRRRARFGGSVLGKFTRELVKAVGEYLELRKQGVSREDASQGFVPLLRQFFRTRPARACPSCDGSGLRVTVCTHGMRCGRFNCSRSETTYEHEYVVPCDCPAGDGRRPREASPEDALAAVGKPGKKKGGSFRRVTE